MPVVCAQISAVHLGVDTATVDDNGEDNEANHCRNFDKAEDKFH